MMGRRVILYTILLLAFGYWLIEYFPDFVERSWLARFGVQITHERTLRFLGIPQPLMRRFYQKAQDAAGSYVAEEMAPSSDKPVFKLPVPKVGKEVLKYSNGQVMMEVDTREVRDGKVIAQTSRQYFIDGKLASYSVIKDGEVVEQKTYYPDGKLAMEFDKAKGEKRKYYNESGDLVMDVVGTGMEATIRHYEGGKVADETNLAKITARPTVADCEGKTEVSERDVCFNNLAFQEMDVSFCARMSSQDPMCYSNIARNKKKLEYCDPITRSFDKELCLSMVAEAIKDTKICENILSVDMKNDCWARAAAASGDPELCFQPIADLRYWQCLGAVAVAKKDITLCEQVLAASGRDYCISSVAFELLDPGLCTGRIWSRKVREQCLQSIAYAQENNKKYQDARDKEQAAAKEKAAKWAKAFGLEFAGKPSKKAAQSGALTEAGSSSEHPASSSSDQKTGQAIEGLSGTNCDFPLKDGVRQFFVDIPDSFPIATCEYYYRQGGQWHKQYLDPTQQPWEADTPSGQREGQIASKVDSSRYLISLPADADRLFVYAPGYWVKYWMPEGECSSFDGSWPRLPVVTFRAKAMGLDEKPLVNTPFRVVMRLQGPERFWDGIGFDQPLRWFEVTGKTNSDGIFALEVPYFTNDPFLWKTESSISIYVDDKKHPYDVVPLDAELLPKYPVPLLLHATRLANLRVLVHPKFFDAFQLDGKSLRGWLQEKAGRRGMLWIRGGEGEGGEGVEVASDKPFDYLFYPKPGAHQFFVISDPDGTTVKEFEFGGPLVLKGGDALTLEAGQDGQIKQSSGTQLPRESFSMSFGSGLDIKVVTFRVEDKDGKLVFERSAPLDKARDEVCRTAPEVFMQERCLSSLALRDGQESHCQEIQDAAEKENCFAFLKYRMRQ